jgi:hypothetical protein
MRLFSCRHRWVTVALDESFGWIRYKGTTNETSGNHLIRYVECSQCKTRDLVCDDSGQEINDYAMKHHSEVAVAKSKWIHGGIIENGNKVIWMDLSRAPLKGFATWLAAIKKDPEMAVLLKDPMVDSALGQLEVAVKLCQK